MKRNEPQWKREAARRYCKDRRDFIWDSLAGKKSYQTDRPDIILSIVKTPVTAKTHIMKVLKSRSENE